MWLILFYIIILFYRWWWCYNFCYQPNRTPSVTLRTPLKRSHAPVVRQSSQLGVVMGLVLLAYYSCDSWHGNQLGTIASSLWWGNYIICTIVIFDFLYLLIINGAHPIIQYVAEIVGEVMSSVQCYYGWQINSVVINHFGFVYSNSYVW